MTKRRMIHSCIWESEGLADLTIRQRLLWVGLITNADDQGRGRLHLKLVRKAIFPFDLIPDDEMQADIDAVSNPGIDLIIAYKIKGKTLYQIINWWEYQKPQWAYPSEYPPPDNWQDRLKHRKENHVLFNNWFEHKDVSLDDFDDANNEDIPLPKGLPKGLGNTDRQGLRQSNSISNSINLNDSTKEKDKNAKIALQNYDYWLKAIRNPKSIGESNGCAVLVRMGHSLYSRFPSDAYGRVGKLSKKAGSMSKLANIFWENATKPLTDPLDYISAIVYNKNTKPPPPTAKVVIPAQQPEDMFGGQR